jgi:glycerol-3-phosphate acyltransferase PlsY
LFDLLWLNLLFVIGAYLLGSFSSAITLSHIMGFSDPRSEGSNNPGATNVLRIAGKKAAALTLVGDVLKGLLPVLLAQWLLAEPLWIALTGFAAFIGHCYPVYYGFEGGKGVATAIGFIVAFHWMTGLVVVAIWLMVAKVFKMSSLAALIAFALMPPIYFGVDGNPAISVLLLLLSLILIWRHRGNIERLLRGEED